MRTARKGLGRGLVWLLLAPVLLVLASCFDVPLGDPAASKVDPRLVGYWQQQTDNGGTIVDVAAFDERTYLIRFRSYEAAGDQLKPTEQSVHKAWLTTIGEATFLTILPLNEMPGLDLDGRPAYVVARLWIEPERISAQGLKPDAPAFKDLADSAAFEAAIRKHLDDADIYQGDRETYRRLHPDNPADRKLIELDR